jgi:hypothetical protein
LKEPGGPVLTSFDPDRGKRARSPTIEQVSAIVHSGAGGEFDRWHLRIDSDVDDVAAVGKRLRHSRKGHSCRDINSPNVDERMRRSQEECHRLILRLAIVAKAAGEAQLAVILNSQSERPTCVPFAFKAGRSLRRLLTKLSCSEQDDAVIPRP